MSQNRSLFTYQTLVHAIAGATGSVVAMAAFYPLDTVRSKLQVNRCEIPAESTLKEIRNIIDKEGFAALYKGIKPVLQSLCASNFIYFYTFHGLKSQNRSNQSALHDLFLGSVAGIINVLTTSPLWVVNTRLKVVDPTNPPPFKNLIEGLIYVGNTEGVSGLWAGIYPSLLLVSNPAIQFMTYEAIKRKLDVKFGELPTLAYFFVGALAKAVATGVTYPIQLIQTKLRHNSDSKQTAMNLILNILRNYGLVGLYKGLEAKLLQTVLTAALMFAMYEKIAKFVMTLLLGNSSKNIGKKL